MPINVGEVQAILSAKDTMSPTVVAAAEAVVKLRTELGALGVQTVENSKQYAELAGQLNAAEARFKAVVASSAEATAVINGLNTATASATGTMKAAATATKELGDAQETTGRQVAAAGQTFQQVENIAQRMIERFLILAAIRFGVKFVEDVFANADALVRLNQSTDLTLERLQLLQFAANSVGVPFEKLASAIDNFDKNLAAVKPTAGDALGSIGLSFEQLFALNPDERLQAVFDAINKLPDGLQRTQAEIKLFGTDAIDPLIKQYDGLADKVNKANGVIEDDGIRALSNTAKAYREFAADFALAVGQIVDQWQRLAAIFAIPLFTPGGPEGQSLRQQFQGLILGSLLGGQGGIDVSLAIQDFQKHRQQAANARDINLPAPGTSQPGTPLMGQAYVDSVLAQRNSLDSLTPEQWAQAEALRAVNDLTLESATRIHMTAEQYRAYTQLVKEWNAEARAASATQKEWDKVQADLAPLWEQMGESGDSWKKTLDTIDGSVVSDAESLLRLGASAHDVQIEYSLTGSQVRALQKDIQDQDKAAREAARSQADWNKIQADLEPIWEALADEGTNYKAVLDTIDGAVVADAEALLRMGASLKDVRAEYDLTASQARALTKDIADQNREATASAKARDEIIKLEDEYNIAIARDSGTTTDVKIAEVNRWADAEKKKYKEAEEYVRTQYYDQIERTAHQRIDAIIHAEDPLWQAWKHLNDDIRTTWADTWDQALGKQKSFVDALLSPFTEMQNRWRKVLASMAADWEQVLLSKIGINFPSGPSGGAPGAAPGGLRSGGGGSFGSIAQRYFGGGGATSGPGQAGYSYYDDLSGQMVDVPPTYQVSEPGGFGGMGTSGYGLASAATSFGLSFLPDQPADQPMTAMGAGMQGAKMGSVAGPYGAAAGFVIGMIVGALKDQRAKDLMAMSQGGFNAGMDNGESTITGSLALKMQDEIDSGVFKTEYAAATGHLADFISAQGGLNPGNIDYWTGHLHDAFSMIATSQMTVAQGTKTLDENWDSFAKAGTDATGRISDGLREIIKLDEQMGTHSAAIAAWQSTQASTAVSGFNAAAAGVLDQNSNLKVYDQIYADIQKAVANTTDPAAQDKLKIALGKIDDAQAAYDRLKRSGNATQAQLDAAQAKIADARAAAGALNPDLQDALSRQSVAGAAASGGLADLGIQAVAGYEANVATGMSPAQALAASHQGLSLLNQAYRDLGLSIDDAALKELLFRDRLMTDAPNLVNAISGLGSEFTALDNLNMMTPERFSAIQRTGQTLYERLLGQVQTELGPNASSADVQREALLQMQDYLHRAVDEAKSLGVPLDDNTLKLIELSKKTGIWDENATKAKDPFEKISDLLDDIDRALRGLPPRVDVDLYINQHGPTPPSPPPEPPPGGGDGGSGDPVPLSTGPRVTATSLYRAAPATSTPSPVIYATFHMGGVTISGVGSSKDEIRDSVGEALDEILVTDHRKLKTKIGLTALQAIRTGAP